MLTRMDRRHRVTTTLKISGSLLFLAAVGAGVAAATGSFDLNPAPPQATFAVLQKPPTLLPAGSQTPALQRSGLDATTDAHLALDTAGLQFFAVAPGAGKQVC